MEVRRVTLASLRDAPAVADLQLAVRPAQASGKLVVVPLGDDREYLSFRGRAGVRRGRERYEGEASLVLTQNRLIGLIQSGINSPGLSSSRGEAALFTVDLVDLSDPVERSNGLGKGKGVRFPMASAGEEVYVNYLPDMKRFVTWFSAAKRDELHLEAAAAAAPKSEDELTAEAKRLAEINAHAAAVRKKAEAKKERSVRGLPLTDHLRVWQFETSLSPTECLRAFDQGLASGGLMRGKWRVEIEGERAVATYVGRRGLGAMGSVISATSEAEEARAAGAQLVFVVIAEETSTRCTMHLAQRTTRLGFTNDARFIRPSMRAVGSRLRKLDPQCSLTFTE